MTKELTDVRGYWRKNPKTGKPVWVHKYSRMVEKSDKKETGHEEKIPALSRQFSGPLNESDWKEINTKTLTKSAYYGVALTGRDYYEDVYKRLSKTPTRSQKDLDHIAGKLLFFHNATKINAHNAVNPTVIVEDLFGFHNGKIGIINKLSKQGESKEFIDGYMTEAYRMRDFVEQAASKYQKKYGGDLMEARRQGLAKYSLLMTASMNKDTAIRLRDKYKGGYSTRYSTSEHGTKFFDGQQKAYQTVIDTVKGLDKITPKKLYTQLGAAKIDYGEYTPPKDDSFTQGYNDVLDYFRSISVGFKGTTN